MVLLYHLYHTADCYCCRPKTQTRAVYIHVPSTRAAVPRSISYPRRKYDVLELDVHPAVAVVEPPVVGVPILELHQHRLALGRLEQRERKLPFPKRADNGVCRRGGAGRSGARGLWKMTRKITAAAAAAAGLCSV